MCQVQKACHLCDLSACLNVLLVVIPVNCQHNVTHDLIKWSSHAQNCLSVLF